ncbi:hypothetical protein GP486_001944 [Trichoglossum hirsutum]|uniref:Histone chaperone RTT106/FACT complex subunit SPT16-like middle domain-containing protein n=1 Tax=Trichoglossum hirsutum TaxID=265104 RepID=A0A9P8LG04_9PEZI|nr:hypothetical protein GP486_001944 [Trichoglossum hirsutum]
MAETLIIEHAFSDQPTLKRAITDAVSMSSDTIGLELVSSSDALTNTLTYIAQTPQHARLFHSIAQYVVDLKSGGPEGAPAAKRRRIDDLAVRHQSSSGGGGLERSETGPTVKGMPKILDGKVLLSVVDIAFSVPQRKKLVLEFFEWGLRAGNVQTGNVEFGVGYKDIQHASCVPVPEKAQRQYNFCIFPPGTDGISGGPNATDGSAIVFTVPDGPPKTASGPEMESGEGVTYKTLLTNHMNKRLPPGRKVEEPNEKVFVSGLVQNHRKGEKAVHVKAFRGSKDGFLFFLPTGILWAFKKPLMFFAFDVIDSTSYTSVVQRTFNLNIATQTSDNTQEFEFSMIDQAEFSGIDAYVRGHGLQDASMAEQRRAKKLNINGAGTGIEEMTASKEENEGEIAKAVREMEDEEDEEEEDYDPGSEGDSEGSCSESEDNEEGGSDVEERSLAEEDPVSEVEDADEGE